MRTLKHPPPAVVFVSLSWDLGVPCRVTTKRDGLDPNAFRYVLTDSTVTPMQTDEVVEAVLVSLARAMGYANTMAADGATDIVRRYLSGEPTDSLMSKDGEVCFARMMRVLGRELPTRDAAAER